LETYEVTIRFDSDDTSGQAAACILHELLMRLRPTASGHAVVFTPRVFAASWADDVAYRAAPQITRERAFRQVNGS